MFHRSLNPHKMQESKQEVIANFEKAVDDLDKFYAKNQGVRSNLNFGS